MQQDENKNYVKFTKYATDFKTHQNLTRVKDKTHAKKPKSH